jgi:hypothetical protein
MSESLPNALDLAQLRQKALSRWENEGGAPPGGHHESLQSTEAQSEGFPLTNAELAQLRVRIIALENTVISLLARSSTQQLNHVREMAAYICPRPGFTPHHLTIRAAAEMIHLIERAGRFTDIPSS